MWNERRVADTLFLRNYERLLKTYGTDYAEVDHRRIDAAALRAFFGRRGFRFARFDNAQRFDFEGVRGRLLSSSYAPGAGHPNHEPMLAELRAHLRCLPVRRTGATSLRHPGALRAAELKAALPMIRTVHATPTGHLTAAPAPAPSVFGVIERPTGSNPALTCG